MNQQEIKQLETDLWDSANTLRANSKLTAAEYKDPVLGLILLRYAQNRYDQAKGAVEASIPEGPRGKRSATKDDFLAQGAMMLPEKSQYDYLADLPEGEAIDEAINEAMRLIENEYPDLQGVLPKNYQEMDTDLLSELIRVFNKDSVKNLTGDVFGRIYEFFLMKFSMDGAGAQEGGEFFTPPSLVQLIVNLIKPDHGIIHDPACGSAGMFVQTGHFLEENKSVKSINEAITCYGTELKSNNTRLAKMNLAIHGIEGKIIEDNSFYSDPHNLVGKCDFVMANPPFNVKKVDKKKDYVKNDVRLFKDVGIPNADNGNYLWIQYFHSYLNKNGRAGFVMTSSATDAGSTEKNIREKLVETGDVDCIVSVGNNFFYTRSLPCHVWFLDKGKPRVNKDKILMIDARNTFRVVTNTINDFSLGQLQNFSTVMESYRGDSRAIADGNEKHQKNAIELATEISREVNLLRQQCQEILDEHKSVSLDFTDVVDELAIFSKVPSEPEFDECKTLIHVFENPVEKLTLHLEEYQTALEQDKKELSALDNKNTDKNKAKKKQLDEHGKLLRSLVIIIKEHRQVLKESLSNYKQQVKDWQFMLENFPENEYQDIEGFCKIVNKDEVKENDFSLTPGRYVGYKIQIDEEFDYKFRISEINKELNSLNHSANDLMNFIQGVKL
ncbi:N-6 DNA methylase [Colwellia demingiae]|uniref:site-specific DNA-methyltransferase (adenine-specific) n=1 Tax=Colwellia demingiae TaxID=89401 RepID=A0A5C6QR31_9GAMM|nr:class I SAM-dependent DNA methyltransferase [Colwellia demingiae]TWX71726.1 N-6 DNA methylase [Colwellia demingiae]